MKKPRKIKCTAADRDCIGGCLCCQDLIPKPRKCEFNYKGHCTGQDIRFIRVREGNNKPFSMSDRTGFCCRGCRDLLNGSWKYS